MYVVRENKSLINAKQIERRKKNKRNKKTTTKKEKKKKDNIKHVSKKS